MQLYGSSISPDTTEALRFVKDTILSFGGILSIPITKALLESSKGAYSRCNANTEAKRHLQKKEEKTKELQKMKNELQEKKDGEDERNNLISSIYQVSLLSETF